MFKIKTITLFFPIISLFIFNHAFSQMEKIDSLKLKNTEDRILIKQQSDSLRIYKINKSRNDTDYVILKNNFFISKSRLKHRKLLIEKEYNYLYKDNSKHFRLNISYLLINEISFSYEHRTKKKINYEYSLGYQYPSYRISKNEVEFNDINLLRLFPYSIYDPSLIAFQSYGPIIKIIPKIYIKNNKYIALTFLNKYIISKERIMWEHSSYRHWIKELRTDKRYITGLYFTYGKNNIKTSRFYLDSFVEIGIKFKYTHEKTYNRWEKNIELTGNYPTTRILYKYYPSINAGVKLCYFYNEIKDIKIN